MSELSGREAFCLICFMVYLVYFIVVHLVCFIKRWMGHLRKKMLDDRYMSTYMVERIKCYADYLFLVF